MHFRRKSSLGAPVLFSPTHLDDHAPSALTNYKISLPLENYSCQYNSTIGGLINGCDREQNLGKKQQHNFAKGKAME